jgi:hypothetical protein
MDAGGIDLQVISHTASAIVPLPGDEAVRLTREANDQLAAAVAAHPDRFAGFATLPMTDPEAAADELERAVRSLGLKGAMINGTTHGRFLDDPSFLPILERSEARENVLPGVMTLLKRRRKLNSSDSASSEMLEIATFSPGRSPEYTNYWGTRTETPAISPV